MIFKDGRFWFEARSLSDYDMLKSELRDSKVTLSIFNNFFSRVFITITLTALGLYMFQYNWRQRPIVYNNYEYSAEEAKRLQPYPGAQYQHGMHAWLQNDHKKATTSFRQAVTQDVLYLDAWHRLAEAENALGSQNAAKDILTFTSRLTEKVYRWKWQQMLLARDLGEENIIFLNANYLLSHDVLKLDVLQLLHSYFEGEEKAVAAVLEPVYWEAYLKWMMRWKMTDKTLNLWLRLIETAYPTRDIGLEYAHFLLQEKRIVESRAIWRQYMGNEYITNPGFENETTRKGFDWLFWIDRNKNWEINRTSDNTYEGDYALKIAFKGHENVSFQHVYQIITTEPLKNYRLSYAWKSENITTDQGLFIEVISYDKKGLYKNGPMMVGSTDWRQEVIDFALPEHSLAAMIRIRRRPSNRFDNKISGSIWLDDFRIERMSPKFTDSLSSE